MNGGDVELYGYFGVMNRNFFLSYIGSVGTLPHYVLVLYLLFFIQGFQMVLFPLFNLSRLQFIQPPMSLHAWFYLTPDPY
jgi:hypothetical protein